MKYVQLENYTEMRIVITALRDLIFEPKTVKYVLPNTATHPAVVPYLGNGLRVIKREGQVITKLDLIEPTMEQTTVSVETTTIEPNAEVVSPVETETSVSVTDEDSLGDLRRLFLSAPGITDKNVDDILTMYSSIDTLKSATAYELKELGVSKTMTTKLIAWIAEQ
jgi:hypothetical protein